MVKRPILYENICIFAKIRLFAQDVNLKFKFRSLIVIVFSSTIYLGMASHERRRGRLGNEHFQFMLPLLLLLIGLLPSLFFLQWGILIAFYNSKSSTSIFGISSTIFILFNLSIQTKTTKMWHFVSEFCGIELRTYQLPLLLFFALLETLD